MTKTIWTAAFSTVVGAATIAALAQTPAPQQNSSTAPANEVTVTGCLQPAPSSATDAAGAPGTAGTTGSTAGTAGAAGTAGSSGSQQFVLTNATLTPAGADQNAAGSTAGAAGSTAGSAAGSTSSAAGTSAESAQSGQTYRLLVNPTSLIPHVGKKLELTGTLVNGTGSSSSASSQASDANAPTLRVTKGKVVAASCQ